MFFQLEEIFQAKNYGFMFSLSFLILLSILLAPLVQLCAQDMESRVPEVEIEPASFELELNVGESIEEVIFLANRNDFEIRWSAQVNLDQFYPNPLLQFFEEDRQQDNPGIVPGRRQVFPHTDLPHRDEFGDIIEEFNVENRNVTDLAVNGNDIWGCTSHDHVFGFDPIQGELITVFSVGANPQGIVCDGEELIVCRSTGRGSVFHVYNIQGELLEWYHLDESVRSITRFTDEICILLSNDRPILYFYNIEDREILHELDISSLFEIESYRVLCIEWVPVHLSGQLWVSVKNSSNRRCTLYQIYIDPDFHMEHVKSIEPQQECDVNIAHDGQNLWHTGQSSSSRLTVIDDGIDDPRWITLEPDEGTIVGDGDENIFINIDATGFVENEYQTNIILTTNDQNNPQIDIPVRLTVDGSPAIQVSHNEETDIQEIVWNDEYEGLLYMGWEYSIPIVFQNVGSDILSIESIETDHEAFSCNQNDLELQPYGRRTVWITFLPGESGEIESVLTIVSNDPENEELQIRLVGETVRGQTLSLEPAEITTELNVGESSEHVINVMNIGELTLHGNAEFQSTNEAEREQTGDILSVHQVPYIETRGLAWDGESMWGISYSENRLIEINPETNEILQRIGIHAMPRAMTFDGENFIIGEVSRRELFVYGRGGNRLARFEPGLDYDGIAFGDGLLFINCRMDNQIHVFDYESLDEVATIAYSGLVGGVDIDCIEWVGGHFEGKLWLNGDNHVFQIGYDRHWESWLAQDFEWNVDQKYSGIAHDGYNLWHGMRSETNWYKHSDGITEVHWISTQSDTILLDQEEDVEIFFTFESEDLIGGEYGALIHFLSDDPRNPDKTADVSLSVHGVPDISVEWSFNNDNVLDWNAHIGGIFPEEQYSVLIRIENEGNGQLVIDSIACENEQFFCNDQEILVQPEQHRTIALFATSEEVGEYRESMVVYSNDPNEGEFEIEMRIEVIDAPDIQVDPNQFDIELEIGDQVDETLTVSNQGESQLSWEIEIDELFEFPERGEIVRMIDLPYEEIEGLTWDGELLWCSSDDADERLFAVHPITREVVHDYQFRKGALAFEDDRIWISYRNIIYKYDRRGFVSEQIGVEEDVEGIAVSSDGFYLLNHRDIYTIRVFDCENNQQIGAIDYSEIINENTGRIEWIDEAEDGKLWIVEGNLIHQIDVNEDWEPEIVATYDWGLNNRHGIACVDEYLWIGHYRYNTIEKRFIGGDDHTWVELNTDSGELEPGEDSEIEFTIISDRIRGGVYNPQFHIYSNDPDEEHMIIDLNLTINGIPEILTIPHSHPSEDAEIVEFSYGENGEESLPIEICLYSSGTDQLEINDFRFDNPDHFRTDLERGTVIAPDDSLVVNLIFNPQEVGEIEGEFHINTSAMNVGDEQEQGNIWFDLEGLSLASPEIEVEPSPDNPILVPIHLNEEPIERDIIIRNVADDNSINLEFTVYAGVINNEQVYNHENLNRPPNRDDPGDILQEHDVPYSNTSGLAWDGELMWGVFRDADRMIALNPENGEIEFNYQMPFTPIDLAWDGTCFWTTHNPQNVLTVIDREGNIVAQHELPYERIYGVAYDPNGYILVNNPYSHVFYVLTIDELEEVATIVLDDFQRFIITWVPEHFDGQLWMNHRSQLKVDQFFIDSDWEGVSDNERTVRKVNEIEWNCGDHNRATVGIEHDGQNLWHGMSNEARWYVHDDGIEEIPIPHWLRIYPNRGSLSRGRRSNIEITYDARDLDEDSEYSATIFIRSNDRDNPEIEIPVLLSTGHAARHYTEFQEMSHPHKLQITELTVNEEPAPLGTEIGVFTPNGLLAGSGVWLPERLEPLIVPVHRDDRQTEEVEGFARDERFCFRLWNPETEEEIPIVGAEFTRGDGNYHFNQTSRCSLHGNTLRELEVNFNEGWSLISINVRPLDRFWTREEGPDILLMTDIFRDEQDEEHSHLIILKDNLGRFCLPEFEFNNIPFWDLTQGYQVLVDEDLTTSIEGIWFSPQHPVNMNSGWNMIAYFPEYELDASAPDLEVLTPVIDRVNIAKDGQGRFMVPAQQFSNMEAWTEGNGYQVNISEGEPVVFRYPVEDLNDENRINHFEKQFEISKGEHWIQPNPTGSNMSLLVTGLEYEEIKGFEIAAISLDGIIAGVGKLSRSSFLCFNSKAVCGFAVWGDDSLTTEIEGLKAGEGFALKLWNPLTKQEDLLRNEFDINVIDLSFEQNTLLVIDIDNLTAIPDNFYFAGGYPNPFNSTVRFNFGLPEHTTVEMRVYNIAGRLVHTIPQKGYEAGHHCISWKSTENSSSGLFFVKMSTTDYNQTRKVILIK
ncbi:MAG: T9SS type A sorting domain-containing protein [Calditrichaeota bacterium]|nr:T9SS type A sorting domain-containing protein [Calditrichota bacterium]